MKRARRQRIFFYVGTCAILLGGWYGIYYAVQRILKTASVHVQPHDTLSDFYTDNLAHTITTNVRQRGPSSIVQMYKHISPILSHLSIRYTFPLSAVVSYDAHTPLICLNDTLCLLPDGTTISSDIFAPDFLTTIPHIEVPPSVLSHTEISEVLKQYAQVCASELLERFSCAWHNEHTCYYRDLFNPRYTLVYEGCQSPAPQDILIYDRIIEQHTSPRTSSTRWLVDLRFKNQVVISSEKGI